MKIDALGNINTHTIYTYDNKIIGVIDPSILSNTASITFDPDGSYKDVSIWTSTSLNTWEPSAGSSSWMTFSSIVQRNVNGWGSFRVTTPKNESAYRTGQIKIISQFNPNLTISTSQDKAYVPADELLIRPSNGTTGYGLFQPAATIYWAYDAPGMQPCGPSYFEVSTNGSWTSSKTGVGAAAFSLSQASGSAGNHHIKVNRTQNIGAGDHAQFIFSMGGTPEANGFITIQKDCVVI